MPEQDLVVEPTIARDVIHEAAIRIARSLMTSGHGRADRLVLVVDGPPKYELGGWSERTVVEQIEAVLLVMK